jgi:hypothetical protein
LRMLESSLVSLALGTPVLAFEALTGF